MTANNPYDSDIVKQNLGNLLNDKLKTTFSEKSEQKSLTQIRTDFLSLVQRLNNISGQIDGVKKMVENESDCVVVLTQLKAIRSAVSSAMDFIVEEQLETCMKSLSKEDKQLLSKIKTYVQYS